MIGVGLQTGIGYSETPSMLVLSDLSHCSFEKHIKTKVCLWLQSVRLGMV